MKTRLMNILLFLMLCIGMCLHVWEWRRIREFSETFALQSQIEAKRTALMVVYQEVLKNMAKELDSLRERKEEPLELHGGDME